MKICAIKQFATANLPGWFTQATNFGVKMNIFAQKNWSKPAATLKAFHENGLFFASYRLQCPEDKGILTFGGRVLPIYRTGFSYF